jgi:uncharacterized protein DUF3634
MSLLPYVLLAGVVLVFLFIVARGNELFLISIRNGQVLVVRGRVPPGYLTDVRAIVRGVPHGEIRAVKDAGHARIVASGVDERVLQRLRNAFSVYPAARLRAAPPIARPTLGQLLGIAWLAWLLDPRR